MRPVILALLAASTLTAACSVTSERTVVEKPVPTATPAAAVVYTDPAPAATTTTVYRVQ